MNFTHKDKDTEAEFSSELEIDEARRFECLQLAVNIFSGNYGKGPTEVIQAAMAFEAYLKGTTNAHITN